MKEDVLLDKDGNLIDSSVNETSTTPPVEEQRVPLSRLKEETDKRRKLETRLEQLEAKQEQSTRSTNDGSDPDLEIATDRLDPYLRKRGFITRDEVEAEKQAEAYAREFKDLRSKYDGKDGRPVFDADEVADFGKKNRIFNMEVAYETLHKKEIRDWEMKNFKGDDEDNTPETEKPGSSGFKEEGNTSILTREYLAKKLNAPGGMEWWEKNREKVMLAISKGQVS